MRSVDLRNGRLLYYGSAVGYRDGDGIVADPMFRREDLEGWLDRRNLEVRWVEGVYDRLAGGQGPEKDGPPLKSLRIWQLRSDTPFEMRFVGLDRMRGQYGGPDPAHYRTAYDGQVGSNDLEAIWSAFCRRELEGADHPLAISDVVELYDESGSDFYYVDRTQLVPVDFGGQEQTAGMTMTL